MTPRLGLYVACVGFVMVALCTAATIAEIRYEEGPPEKSWGNHGVWMDNISLVWVPIAIAQRETRVGNLALLYLLYAGGLLGLTVMVIGLAMAGVGARVQGGAPRIALGVAGVGLLIAVLCAGLGMSDVRAYYIVSVNLGVFVGLVVIVVGLVMAGVAALVKGSGK